jgi:hypothetical protein
MIEAKKEIQLPNNDSFQATPGFRREDEKVTVRMIEPEAN